MTAIEIRLKKVNKTYQKGEKICGTVAIDGRGELLHSGITLCMEGVVSMHLSAKSVGMFEAFYNSVKPINVIQNTMEIAKPGKLPNGFTEIPFEIILKPLNNKQLYESYSGVFINVNYTLTCVMKRSFMYKDLQTTCELMVEKVSTQKNQNLLNKKVLFKITPQGVHVKTKGKELPSYLISGHLDTVICDITKPFLGEVVVTHCDKAIKSIEIQLVRVETCGCAEGYAKDATEIQNLQIADGNICKGLHIPIYMIFPRLFTCPTIETTNFKIEFEVNLVVVFIDDNLLTENFPLTIYR